MNMNDKVFLSMDKVVDIDPAKIDVPEMMEKDFWLHHDHKEEDKYELFQQCSMVPDILRKLKNNELLSPKERYAYNLYYGNEKPELYQEANGKIRTNYLSHSL